MKAVLDRLHQESVDITTFFFRPECPLRHIAGQFIELTLPHADMDSRGYKRWFTISSAPGHELFTITARLASHSSSFKRTLWGLQTGDEVDISEPMGDFVLPKDAARRLVFVAGGIGITPFHSIIQWLEDTKQSREIQFVYSVRQADDKIFWELFNKEYIQRTALIGESRLTAKEINKLIGGIADKQIFISGPEPMTEAIVEQFKQDFGLTQDQLITDYFPGYEA